MPNIITFSVVNQRIRRTDEMDVVADSQNYLTAKFNFETFQWEGLTKTALFRIGTTGTVYGMVLDDDDTCEVPHEVLVEGGHYIHVSVFAGDLITANVAKVFVQESGYWSDAESSSDPTPSVYQQIIDKLDEIREDTSELVDIKESVEEGARIATEMAQQTQEDAQAVSADKDTVVTAKNDAISAKNVAVTAKDDAGTASTSASASAESASESASLAAQYEPPTLANDIIHFPYGGGGS